MAINSSKARKVGYAAAAGLAATALTLAGCASTPTETAAPSEPILIGTTDKIVSLDPVGSYDNG